MAHRLAILQSHPVQYFVPLYRRLAARPEVDLKVFYCLRPTSRQQGAGFGVEFQWDVPLLDGYEHEFLCNQASQPGLHFWGCDTPGIGDLVRSSRFDAWLVPGWNLKSYWQLIRVGWRQKVPVMIRCEANLLDWRPLHIQIAKRLILGRWIPRFAAYLTIGKLNEEFYRVLRSQPFPFFCHPVLRGQRFLHSALERRAPEPG